MEVEDVFEEWDGSDMIDMEEIESVSYGERIDENKSKGEDSVNSDSENESDDDVDNDDEKLLRCKNCRKIYRTKSWFLKHRSVCDGASKKQKKIVEKVAECHNIQNVTFILLSMVRPIT